MRKVISGAAVAAPACVAGLGVAQQDVAYIYGPLRGRELYAGVKFEF